jgi:peptidoglycan-associated lipoprotein
MRTLSLAALLLSSTVALGCSSTPKPPPAAPTGGTEQPKAQATATNPQTPEKNPEQSQINISDEIRKACGISDKDAYFAFDSAHVRPEDEKILHELATCFTSGPLAGKKMSLVGHADPRGDAEYNMVLGGRRADNVKQYLAKESLNPNQVVTSSRGAMDATGTDEAGWAKDRRVDVNLVH